MPPMALPHKGILSAIRNIPLQIQMKPEFARAEAGLKAPGPMFLANEQGADEHGTGPPGNEKTGWMTMNRALIAGLALAGLAAGAAEAANGARGAAHLMSAASTLTFAEGVAQRFVERGGEPAPRVEIAGDDEIYRRFCAGLGLDTPDLILVAGRMDASKRAACMTNGVTRIAEVKLGYEALVLVNKADAPAFDLTPRQIFLAVARRVPRGGELVTNSTRRWRQIDARLPDLPIEVIGPAAGSETARLFREQILHEGCRAAGLPTRLSPAERAAVCRELRGDGIYRAAGDADHRGAIAQVRSDPTALAVLPLSLLQRDGEGLAANAIDGALPTAAAIAFGDYRAGAPIHLYVKLEQAARVGGLMPFARAMAAQGLTGPDGPLVQQGLVPLPRRDQLDQKAKAAGLTDLH